MASIPEEILQYRPGPCTEVKWIRGHYYVYMYEAVQLKSGRWGKKSGKCIGSIIPGKGFTPNKNYSVYYCAEDQDDYTILEYGLYGLAETAAADIYASLNQFFPLNRAAQIFVYALILFVNGFVSKDQVHLYYEQSWLSQEYKDFPFKMGQEALSTLLDDLGRKTTRVVNYENHAISHANKIAVDGYAIRSCSDENDLGETGCPFELNQEDQVNFVMGYDLDTGMPLYSRMFRGPCQDKEAVKEIMGFLSFTGILFVIDQAFYSGSNLALFSSNGNCYIIPVPDKKENFLSAIKDLRQLGEFYYRSSKRCTRVEYTSHRVTETETVYVFRDREENENFRYDYKHNMELRREGYTQENTEQCRDTFGVYVLQSNAPLPPEDIFSIYKKSGDRETFCQYVKNDGDFNNLPFHSYFEEQGFAFLMLVAGQIYQAVRTSMKSLNDNSISMQDIMLMAQALKMERKEKAWHCVNARKKDLEILKKMGFEPVGDDP